MRTMNARISHAMFAVVELCERLGVRGLNAIPGCWEHQVDRRWWIAVNGHKEPIACSRGIEVPPFHCYAELDGFSAGMFNSFGGTMVVNEAEFIAAVDKARQP